MDDALKNGKLVNLIRTQLDELLGLGLRTKELLSAFGKALLDFIDSLSLTLIPVRALELSTGHRYLVLKSGDEIIRGRKPKGERLLQAKKSVHKVAGRRTKRLN